MAVNIIRTAQEPDKKAPETDWGQEIKRIRKSQGLSQRGLAKLAEVHRSSLRRFESKSNAPGSLMLFEALASALGYEIDLFFKGFGAGGLTEAPHKAKAPVQPDKNKG